MKSTLLYAETIAILVVVAVVVQLAASVDWPWAIAIGAGAAVLARALIHRKAPVRPKSTGDVDDGRAQQGQANPP